MGQYFTRLITPIPVQPIQIDTNTPTRLELAYVAQHEHDFTQI